jgi:hypothetical protein
MSAFGDGRGIGGGFEPGEFTGTMEERRTSGAIFGDGR